MNFLQPRTLPELSAALAQPERVRLVAGCTDFLAQRNGTLWTEETLVSLTELDALRRIEDLGDCWRVGALCTHAQVAASPAVRAHFPALAAACGAVGCAQIRNRGTLGGSIGTASPAGDVYPVLLALHGAAVVLDAQGAQRSIAAEELLTGRGRTALRPDEAILYFTLPRPAVGETSAFGKVGERHQVTISKLNLALSAVVADGHIVSARAALGAVAPTAYLSGDAADFLAGKPLTRETGEALGALLSDEVAHIIATRDSMPYKREAVRALAADTLPRLAAAE